MNEKVLKGQQDAAEEELKGVCHTKRAPSLCNSFIRLEKLNVQLHKLVNFLLQLNHSATRCPLDELI